MLLLYIIIAISLRKEMMLMNQFRSKQKQEEKQKMSLYLSSKLSWEEHMDGDKTGKRVTMVVVDVDAAAENSMEEDQ